MMKLLENKIQEQSKEIAIRSKTIEELQYSLNLLIGKYNELKNKYDGVLVEVKEISQKKIPVKYEKVNQINILFTSLYKNHSLNDLENENIRLKHKLNQQEEEFNNILSKKDKEIISNEKLVEDMKLNVHNLTALEETLKIKDNKLQEIDNINQKVIKDLRDLNEQKENFCKKYQKYKTKYVKLQNDLSLKTHNLKVINGEANLVILSNQISSKSTKSKEKFVGLWERSSEFTLINKKGLLKRDIIIENIKENITKVKENLILKMRTFESKIMNTIKSNETKIADLGRKMVGKLSKLRDSDNEIDFKRELISEVNKFNEINSTLSNKVSKLEVEKTKLFFQLQNYENIIQKSDKKIKSLTENLSEHQNTILKLNLKVEGLVTENNKINKKEMSTSKEELEREKGLNFILTKKVFKP